MTVQSTVEDNMTSQQLLDDLHKNPLRLTYTRDSVLCMIAYTYDKINNQLKEKGGKPMGKELDLELITKEERDELAELLTKILHDKKGEKK